MDFRFKTFEAGEIVKLDGNRFITCVFNDGCAIEWFGDTATHFEGCTFGHIRWRFGPHATQTIALLQVLWGASPNGDIVRAILDTPIVPEG